MIFPDSREIWFWYLYIFDNQCGGQGRCINGKRETKHTPTTNKLHPVGFSGGGNGSP
jgi:hypothetical protein